MQTSRITTLTLLAIGACLALTWPAGAADATTRSCAITQFYAYPGGDGDMNKLAGLAWPEVETLHALIKVELAGLRGEEKISVFLAVTDPENDDAVVAKFKSKHFLPNGTHDIVFPDFLRTGSVFGKRGFDLHVELDLAGVKPVTQTTSFVVTGPDPPEVDIADLLLYNPAGDKNDRHFEPGDEFALEATVEIEGNDGGAQPRLIVLGVLEDDIYETDPGEAQAYDAHWDSRAVDAGNGVYRLTARGFLPLFFASPYDLRHYFRLYVIVDFGPGFEQEDYVLGEIIDYHSGDSRRSDNIQDRLIELQRGYQWGWDRLRGGTPEPRRFWDD